VELVADLTPTSLVDIGCGSGVVSIAAALLGFAPVTAVDIDPAAVEATLRNATANHVSLDVLQLDATTAVVPPADVVVANVSLTVVEALLQRLRAETVIVSGYLETDDPATGSFVRRARRVLDGWAADMLGPSQ
jgi:ribosomal protein L11 methyltransferase